MTPTSWNKSVVLAGLLAGCSFAWEATPTEVTRTLNDVAAAAPGRAWAVGESGLILSFENGAWKEVERITYSNVTRVRPAPEGQAWAVTGSQEVLHFDGAAWSVLDYPGGSAVDVLPLGPNDALFVGEFNGGDEDETTAWRWNGDSWRQVLYRGRPRGIAGTSATDYWVFGAGENPSVQRKTEREFVDVTPSDLPFDFRFKRIEVGSDGVPWVAGGAGNAISLVFRRDGDGWKRIEAPEGADDLRAIWPVDARTLYAVGEKGGIWRFEEDVWTVSLPQHDKAATLRGVGGTSATDVWAVGESGVALRMIQASAP